MSVYAQLTYTSADGLTLAARDYAAASGPARLPVICIHGLTRNAADFDELAPLLARQSRRVLALDVRGRGESARDPNPANYNPVTYAGDVARLMHDLGLARAVFIGTSMGGLITMTLAMRNLDLVAAAVLNDIGPVMSRAGLARIAGYAGTARNVGTWEEATAYVKDINRCAFPANEDAEWDKWAHRAFAQEPGGALALRYDPHVAAGLQEGKLRPTSLMARLAFKRLSRHRPTLLIRGTLSDLVEERQADYMRRTAPGMQYAEVPNVGHAPMLTEPAALAALQGFLAHVP
ncbi:alpha/beta fold hydrolase [Massilia sp. S19_KUP03_FR1]|uniref:alpha/beta fold hydrolase n=1 Tax=Massilia sp. S19_KUP03_FR1 TaxID=3025503 RepID=UPI002FCD9F8B